MSAWDNILARWNYTDREAEMIEDLFSREGAERSRHVADFLLQTCGDIERPTFQKIARLFEQGVGEVTSKPPSTMTPPPSGRELSNAEKNLFWKWIIAMFSSLPSARAQACREYMDASSKAGHEWSTSFKQVVFGHWKRNTPKVATP